MFIPTPGTFLTAGSGATYTLDKRLGGGRYGEVWRVTSKNGEKLALKLMLDALTEADQRRFAYEVDVLGLLHYYGHSTGQWSVDTPMIPIVVDRQLDARCEPLFFVQKLAPGRPLDELLRERGYLAEHVALTLLAQVCRVFEILHTHLQRSYLDFQPRNVFWDEVNEHVMVIDWNLLSQEGQADIKSDLAHLTRLVQRTLLGQLPVEGSLPQRWGDLTQAARNLIEDANPQLLPDVKTLREKLEAVKTWWGAEDAMALLIDAALFIEKAKTLPEAAQRQARRHVDGLLSIATLKDAAGRTYADLLTNIATSAKQALPVMPQDKWLAAYLAGNKATCKQLLSDLTNQPFLSEPDHLTLIRWKLATESLTGLPGNHAVISALETLKRLPMRAAKGDEIPILPPDLPGFITVEWQALDTLAKARRANTAISSLEVVELKGLQDTLAALQAAEVAFKSDQIDVALKEGLEPIVRSKNLAQDIKTIESRIADLTKNTELTNQIARLSEKPSNEAITLLINTLSQATRQADICTFTTTAIHWGQAALAAGKRDNAQSVVSLYQQLIAFRVSTIADSPTEPHLQVPRDMLADAQQLDVLNELHLRAKRVLLWHGMLDRVEAMLAMTHPEADLQGNSVKRFGDGLQMLVQAHRDSGLSQVQERAKKAWIAAISQWASSEKLLENIPVEARLVDLLELNALSKEIAEHTQSFLTSLADWHRKTMLKETAAVLEEAKQAHEQFEDFQLEEVLKRLTAAAVIANEQDNLDLIKEITDWRSVIEADRGVISQIAALEHEAKGCLTAVKPLLVDLRQACILYTNAETLLATQKRQGSMVSAIKNLKTKCEATLKSAEKQITFVRQAANKGNWLLASTTLAEFEATYSGDNVSGDVRGSVADEFNKLVRNAAYADEWVKASKIITEFEAVYSGQEAVGELKNLVVKAFEQSARKFRGWVKEYNPDSTNAQTITNDMTTWQNKNITQFVRENVFPELKQSMDLVHGEYKTWHENRPSNASTNQSAAKKAIISSPSQVHQNFIGTADESVWNAITNFVIGSKNLKTVEENFSTHPTPTKLVKDILEKYFYPAIDNLKNAERILRLVGKVELANDINKLLADSSLVAAQTNVKTNPIIVATSSSQPKKGEILPPNNNESGLPNDFERVLQEFNDLIQPGYDSSSKGAKIRHEKYNQLASVLNNYKNDSKNKPDDKNLAKQIENMQVALADADKRLK